MQHDLAATLIKHKNLFTRVVALGDGTCWCGRGESCSVCTRSKEQRALEADAADALKEIDTILNKLLSDPN